MMLFRTIKTQIVSILDAHASERFRVIGNQKQSRDADTIKDNNRLVQVYYDSGNFDQSSGRNSSKTHKMKFSIDLSASAAAKGDLSALEYGTPAQKANALASLREAAEVADNLLDELIDIVFNILMDARYDDLQIGRGAVNVRWIDSIKKDTLLERGEFVVKTANLSLSVSGSEVITGDIGNEPATVIIDSSITGDVPSSGATVENDNT